MTLLALLDFIFQDWWHFVGSIILLLSFSFAITMPIACIMDSLKESFMFASIHRKNQQDHQQDRDLS